jgi:hypothetical protein
MAHRDHRLHTERQLILADVHEKKTGLRFAVRRDRFDEDQAADFRISRTTALWCLRRVRPLRQSEPLVAFYMWKTFVEQVGLYFSYLEKEYSFTCESLKPPLVCYGSDKLRIYIHYDANSRHELDLVLMSRDDTSPTPLAISMGMLVRLRNPGNPETFEPAHPTHDESLKFEVARLAKLLKEHGSLLLEGNMSDFLRVEELEARLAKDQKRGTR